MYIYTEVPVFSLIKPVMLGLPYEWKTNQLTHSNTQLHKHEANTFIHIIFPDNSITVEHK